MTRIVCALCVCLSLHGCDETSRPFCPAEGEASHRFFGPPNSEHLIIFIHGLCGDATSTWINPETHFDFPQQLAQDLSKENQPTHVVSFDYVSRLKNTPSILSIVDHLDFEISELLKAHPYRTLRIVAHSMGAIIAREYILRRHLRSHPELDITNLVLLATPNNGSELASLKRLIPKNRQVEELRHIDKGNSYLESLNADWNRDFKGGAHPRHLLLYAGYEELPTFPFDKIVHLSSAIAFADESIGFQKDHISIAKPKDRDVIYRWVKSKLEESLEAMAQKLVKGLVNQGILKSQDIPERLPRIIELLQQVQSVASAHLQKVVSYIKSGELQKALDLLSESEKKEYEVVEQIAERRFVKATIYELQSDMEGAKINYAEAVRLSPSNSI